MKAKTPLWLLALTAGIVAAALATLRPASLASEGRAPALQETDAWFV